MEKYMFYEKIKKKIIELDLEKEILFSILKIIAIELEL